MYLSKFTKKIIHWKYVFSYVHKSFFYTFQPFKNDILIFGKL
uniref:Uncharacterized protein n=1 Tax=Anguilla anguilla TaxID=7936 RepID=A0A0E9TAF7_ANGAN